MDPVSQSVPDLGDRFTKHLRNQNLYECDQCLTPRNSELKLWAHYRDSHPELIPQADDELRRFRELKKDACRKRSDKTSPTQKPPGNPSWQQRWQSHDRKGQADFTWPKTKGEFTGGSGVQDIEKGTGDISLQPGDPDIAMNDVQPENSPPSLTRKRTGTDSAMEGAGSSIQVRETHGSKSPKRTRAQVVRGFGDSGGRGGGVVGARGTRGGRKSQQIPDPDFDRSITRYKTEQVDDEKDDSAVPRGANQPRRLFDPDRDAVSCVKPEDDRSKRLEDYPLYTGQPQNVPSGRNQGFRSKKEQKKKDPRLFHPHFRNAPVAAQQHQPQGSREGGRIMILNNAQQARAQAHSQHVAQEEDDPSLAMVREPETRPISPEQLIAEVKGIYAGLVMVEAKCCEVDAKQAAEQPRLNNEQWQALIALHRTLLHEHHDFFLASQHPSAGSSLRRLASKYAMPARMWRHGIHSFLELLRHRLPHSLEHMLTFIYLAYSMMALLYETVPAFEDTWIECLGDLGRYRMAIEDDDVRDREVWTNVARSWYSKAADKTPTVGRLYHHLAILARPNVLQQLFFYCKSLGVSQPFSSARESILTLFDPIFAPDSMAQKSQPVDSLFIQLHGISFTHIDLERFDDTLDEFLDVMDKHISRAGSKWKVQGCYVAICNITGLYQYGAKNSVFRQAWRETRKSAIVEDEIEDAAPAAAPSNSNNNNNTDVDSLLPPLPTKESSEHVTTLLQPVSKLEKDKRYENKTTAVAKSPERNAEKSDAYGAVHSVQHISLGFAKRLAFSTLSLALERVGDSNVLPHIHVWLVFMAHIKASDPAIRLLENEFPWEHLAAALNCLISEFDNDSKIESEKFPVPDKGVGRPLPEDYTIRGLDWAKKYFPDRWFEDANVDDEERALELPSMENIRSERVLWLACRLCASDDWLKYDSGSRQFSMHPTLQQRIIESKKRAATHAECTVFTPTSEDSDVEMAAGGNDSEDEGFVVINQSDEFRKLKQQERQLKSQLETGKAVDANSVETSNQTATVKGPEALKRHYTILVVDTNLLVSHLETLRLIVSTSDWSVVIPNCVITELLGLTNNPGSVGDSAKAAMLAINDAVIEKRDVKVVTAKGSNVTNIGFYKEQLDKHGEDDFKNIDDIIIQTAKQQGDMRRQSSVVAGEADPAVLITEDRNMRVKANARGVTAIAASALKRILSPKKQRFSDWNDEDSPYPIAETSGDFDGTNVAKNGGKRRHKRGKTDTSPNGGV